MRLLSFFVLSAVLSASALALEVPFTVEEPIGAAREVEVASGGIPFPEGKYKDPAAFSLFDGATEVPVQVSPMVKYPDGSLHWALISFPVSLKAKEKKTFTLKDTPGKAAPANPVTVKEDGDAVTVSNGLVSFTVNKANFNGFESIKLKDKEVFKAAKAGLVANGKGGPGKPTHFAFYYRGPVKTTIYVKGLYGDQKAPSFAMAITLNAGENAIHIAHSLRNGAVGASKMSISAADICLGLAGDLKAEGGGTPPSGKGAAAFGWQNFSGAADLLVFMRHGGPGNKGAYKVDAADGQLAVHLNPGDGECGIAEGAHKATDVDLVFGKSSTTEALSEPLHALASCAYLSENDGFGVGKGWGSLADETQTYKNADWKNADDPKKMPREAVNPNIYFGWFDSHATSECDHLQGMLFGYVRTGQHGFLDQARGWSRYWRTYLLWRSDEWLYGKDGKYNTPKWGVGRCCTEGCHFYGVGIFNYALLTGEIDALEAAYDWAEMANVAWYGRYTNVKPGDSISGYGSRGFSRSYLAIARAYDVSRDKYWQECLLHYVNVATQAKGRDPRGFTTAWSSSNPGSAADRFKKDRTALDKTIADEGITTEGKFVKHPKYGSYQPMTASSWPEAMESQANYMAYEALRDSTDPACQLAAEDAMDYCIAEAYLGLHYIYNAKDNCVYYYMAMDYPRPDDCGGGSNDSWYTKWWPNTMGYGYKLTGDKALKERMVQMLWWGLARDYVNPPRTPQGEAPTYGRVEHNTKGDWMTPTAFAVGIGARPKKDEAPPAAIADLKATSLGGGKVELSWTAPKDEGGGKVVKYQVKFASRPLCDYLTPGDDYRSHFKDGKLDVTYWNMAKNVLGEPVPGEAGKAEKATITVDPGTVYISIRSYDDSHNQSKLGNVVQVEAK